ncbi:uncharacterized protein LOC108743243 isoform X2 [Agrilus planipennis]|nr:uncharacterized protein LOC108743243 isoform X2 [Agrilus planipennis]XP_018334224.1 uncharacterized protein LOC108743243 isoform X2 [Agrilus planipennis]
MDVPEKPARISASVRQVHPVCEDKAQVLAYEKDACVVAIDSIPPPPPPPVSASHRGMIIDHCGSSPVSAQTQTFAQYYSKRASTDSNPSPVAYPLTPNICVESGRIEFIKTSVDVATIDAVATPPTTPNKTQERITVTRGSQTETIGDEKLLHEAKEKLEIRVAQLEASLEAAQTAELRDRQVLSKLQRQLSRRESSQRDADRERRLRAESEARTKQALQEAARCRARLRLLTNEFTRMEETVRSMLVYKSRSEQLRQEKTALTVAFENRCQQYQNTITRLNKEISSLREQLDQINLDPSLRDGAVAAQTAALHKQAEESRRQYERCLDDVANQVVKALLAQKGLKEEISNLNKRIQDLESQNRTLTSMLVHQLQGDSTSLSDSELSPSRHLALEEYKDYDATSTDASPSHILTTKQSSDMKHCNSFNSDVLNETKSESFVKMHEKHLSADSNVVDNKLSLEDKKRHQVLTRLWTELKGAEVTPKRLLEALSAVDPSFRLPPQRPVSLNLHLPIFQTAKGTFRSRPVLAQTCSKSEEETIGNESPESGNRDEGYSTMSSDVQAEVTKPSSEVTVCARGLEELKEAIDETDIVESRLFIAEAKEPDVLYIPINLLSLNPRNSYPPTKDILPFQHIMRSFSDSHLCIKITTSPSPCYSLSSPISSSPSILFLDITEKKYNPLRRTKATNSLVATTTTPDFFDDPSSPALEEHLELTSWDAEYIQHWLLLDETRSAIQQHQRDLLELEYDRTELEDWSLSLSSDDVRAEQLVKKYESVTTPSQISLSTLPSIQENNALELEEDANECLWNGSSYMMDGDGHEIVTLLMDAGSSVQAEKQWPYAVGGTGNNSQMANSPENSSWSSNGSDCCHSYEPETCSKRSSAALSGCSDDTSEMPAIGTDFTRDFYRLVKFESTKSLASTSSRSLGGALSENGDREMALQNVLTFIAEQQKYTQNKDSRPCSVTENTKDFNVEGPQPASQCLDDSKNSAVADENYIKVKHLTSELSANVKAEDLKYCNISYAEEVCLVTPLDVESENCSNICVHPVDICSSVNVDAISSSMVDMTSDHVDQNSVSNDINKSCDSDNTSATTTATTPMSESLTSTISTSDTVVSKIPRLKPTASKIPVSPNRVSKTSPISNNNNKNNNINNNEKSPKLPRSKIPYKKLSTPTKNQAQPKIHDQSKSANEEENIHVITAERLPRFNPCDAGSVIEGPPHRAISFHERATSKDVIDELNRIIQKGDDGVQQGREDISGDDNMSNPKLDENCKATGWIHVEKDIDLTDPKARANLLDVMMASVSSDSSPTSSCGGSITSDSNEEPPDYGHLHRIHKFHRQKKVHAHRPELAVVRMPPNNARPSIIGRPDFYVRYGEKEREAVACFDFLDNFSNSSSSSSDNCSLHHNDVEKCIVGNDRDGHHKGMIHACYKDNDGMMVKS